MQYSICPVCGTGMRKGKTCSVCRYSENTDYELHKTLGMIEGEVSTIQKSIQYKAETVEAREQEYQKKIKSLNARLLAMLLVCGVVAIVIVVLAAGKIMGNSNSENLGENVQVAASVKKETNPAKDITAAEETTASKKETITDEDANASEVKTTTSKETTASKKETTTTKEETTHSKKQEDEPEEVDLGIEVGDIITFGKYEQDNVLDNGAEKIDWRVLAVKKDKVLIQSVHSLDQKSFNDGGADATWDECSLREWLNHDFLKGSFTKKERAKIVKTKIKAGTHPVFTEVDQGKDTEDYIFLLSIAEAEKYYKDSEDRLSIPTLHTIVQGAYVAPENNCSWWWLRNTGENRGTAADVYSYGDVDYDGSKVGGLRGTVRPALWMKPL